MARKIIGQKRGMQIFLWSAIIGSIGLALSTLGFGFSVPVSAGLLALGTLVGGVGWLDLM